MREPVLVGTCQICGDEVYQYTTMSCEVAYVCGRCGKWTCSSCGGLSPGYGYGSDDEAKYGKVCKECYYEMQETYAERWEVEFGDEATIENPYRLTDEDRQTRERMRGMTRRDAENG